LGELGNANPVEVLFFDGLAIACRIGKRFRVV
jgi:hypothetical protein